MLPSPTPVKLVPLDRRARGAGNAEMRTVRGKRSREAGGRPAVGKIDLKRAEQRQPGIIQSDPCFARLAERGKSVCFVRMVILRGRT